MSELLGLVGVLVVCAGMHVLWQSRREVAYWLAAYFRVFRALLRHPGTPVPRMDSDEAAAGRPGTLRILLGMGLVFLLGPFLIALGLTLMLVYNL